MVGTVARPAMASEPYAHTIEALAAEIRDYFAAHADPNFYEKYAWTLGEGYDPYGLPPGTIDGRRDEWLEAHRAELGLNGFIDLGSLLWQSGKWEDGLLAISFVEELKGDFGPDTFGRLGGWFESGLHNWVHCDMVCSKFLSHLLDRGLASLDDLAEWRYSEFKFKRRAVPTTARLLLRKSKSYTELLDFLRPLMADPEHAVQQAVGGLLNDAWRKRPDQAEPFLLEWKDISPKAIIKQATKNMPAEKKARFQRAR